MRYFIYIVAALAAYLIGSFSTSYVISRIRKNDIRTQGSNNLGASNTTLILGWKFGVIVGLCDILKGTIPVLIVRLCFPSEVFLPYLVGCTAVLGHIYPFYLKFKGGKGFATFVGITLGLDWRYFLVMGVAIILITLIFDYIVIATFTTIISFPIYTAIIADEPMVALLLLPASLIIIYKHLPNIKRIITGKELGIRSTFKKKKKKDE